MPRSCARMPVVAHWSGSDTALRGSPATSWRSPTDGGPWAGAGTTTTPTTTLRLKPDHRYRLRVPRD